MLPKTPISKHLKDTKNQTTAKQLKNAPEKEKEKSEFLQELKNKRFNTSSSKSDSTIQKTSQRGSGSVAPPPVLRPKPSTKTPPSVPSKPSTLSKANKSIPNVTLNNTDDKPADSSTTGSDLPKKRLLPPVNSSKAGVSSDNSSIFKRDLRPTASFRTDISKSKADSEQPKKDLKPTGSFRSTLGKTTERKATTASSLPSTSQSRLKANKTDKPIVPQSVNTSEDSVRNNEMVTKKDSDSETPFKDSSSDSMGIVEEKSNMKRIDKDDIFDDTVFAPSRKSSISHVESPQEKDKSAARFDIKRKSSITGSAYAPIGFRSSLGSSDSEPKSRGGSISSNDTSVLNSDNVGISSNPRQGDATLDSVSSDKDNLKPVDIPVKASDRLPQTEQNFAKNQTGSRSRDNSFTNTECESISRNYSLSKLRSEDKDILSSKVQKDEDKLLSSSKMRSRDNSFTISEDKLKCKDNSLSLTEDNNAKKIASSMKEKKSLKEDFFSEELKSLTQLSGELLCALPLHSFIHLLLIQWYLGSHPLTR